MRGKICEEQHLINKGYFYIFKSFQLVKTHLYKLPVMFQLFLECLDTLVEVFSVDLVVLLCLQALGFLLFQLSLEGPEAQGQRAVVLFCLPLQVQPVLGQTLRLCQESLKQTQRKVRAT